MGVVTNQLYIHDAVTLDSVIFDELCCILDDSICEIVNMYFEDTPQALAELHVASDKGDAKALREVAHRLKSSCGNIGAVKLQMITEQIEIIGRKGKTEESQSLIALAEIEFSRVEEVLRERHPHLCKV
jgi:HPt (histidine-containing phosphotransfer) domain-containing protein